jgi:hypothetical protein
MSMLTVFLRKSELGGMVAPFWEALWLSDGRHSGSVVGGMVAQCLGGMVAQW